MEFVKEELKFRPGATDPYATFQPRLIGAVTQLERELIRERQREGIEAAKKRGVYKGRKRTLTIEQIRMLRSRVMVGESKAAIARDLGMGRTTLYRYLSNMTP